MSFPLHLPASLGSAPAPALVDLDVAATRYWVLRGTIGDDPVAWSDVAVAHPGGPVEPRLLSPPSSFNIGIPTAVGAAPEKLTTTVEIDNADRALDTWATGSTRTPAEYASPSPLTFRGRIYRGTIAADGTITEEPFTPELVASSGIDIDRSRGTISITLSHADERAMGQIVRTYSIADLARDGVLEFGVTWRALTEALGIGSGMDLWGRLLAMRGVAGSETALPWLYGTCSVPLEKVTPEGVFPAVYSAGVFFDHSGKVSLALRSSIAGKVGSEWRDLSVHEQHPIPFGITFSLGGRTLVFVGAVQAKQQGESPPTSLTCIAKDPLGTREEASPAGVLSDLLQDHSEIGADLLHSASWAKAVQAQGTRYGSCIAGYIGESTTIAELIEVIAPVGNLGLWFDSEGKLRVYLGGWTHEDKATAQGELPTILEPDIFPGEDEDTPEWRETISLDPDDRGAVVSRVSVEWSSTQRDLFPPETGQDRFNAQGRVPISSQVELRLNAAWVDPRAAQKLLGAAVSRAALPARRVSTVSHASLARLGTGQMVRATHSLGLSAEGDYRDRLLRIERGEVMPEEHAAALVLEDLGPAEARRLGVLDSIAEWVAYNPAPAGMAIGFEQDVALIGPEIGRPAPRVFTQADVGRVIWGPPSAYPGFEGVTSYVIYVVHGPHLAGIDPPFSDKPMQIVEASSPSTPLVRAAWLLMRTHLADAPYRPDYIRTADAQDGKLSDGENGYAFGSH